MEGKTKKDWRFWVFLVLSILWSIRVFWLLIEDQYFSGFSGSMPLNEVGDFLAGSFSPLAFAWLAYGYWMQNKELRYNNHHQSKFLNVANDQLYLQKNTMIFEHIKQFNESQPFFEIFYIERNERKIKIQIKNESSPAFDFEFGEYIDTSNKEPIEYTKKLHKNHLTFQIDLDKPENTSNNSSLFYLYIYDRNFYISYMDGFGRYQNINISIQAIIDDGENKYEFIFQNEMKALPEI